MKKTFPILLVMVLSMGSCTVHYAHVTGSAVHFYLKAPQAKVVEFAASFDGYEPRPARKGEDGTWEALVPSGREFRYFFVVDGRAFTPPCPLREKDDFGSENCIFAPDL